MLKRLAISNLGPARQVDVEFGPHLNVLTGESGAGKSLLLKAIEILFNRVPSGSLTSDPQGASSEIRAEFELDNISIAMADVFERMSVNEALEQHKNGKVVLEVRRTISHGKNSRTQIFGRPVGSKHARELFDCLFELHRQHDHLWLMDSSRYAELLDRYENNVLSESQNYRLRYVAIRRDIEHLKEAMQRRQDAASRSELLQFQLSDIESFGDDVRDVGKLEAELKALETSILRSRLVDKVLRGVDEYEGEGEKPELRDALAASLAALRKLDQSDPGDPKVTKALIALEKTALHFEEVRECLEIPSEPEMDSVSVDMLRDKISGIKHLEQKYGVQSGCLSIKAESIRAELDLFNALEADLKASYERLTTELQKLQLAGESLSLARGAATSALNSEIAIVLKDLNLDQTSVKFVLESISLSNNDTSDQTDSAAILLTNFGSLVNGFERIEIMMASAGERMVPLRSRASGGELSRVMLALRSVLAGDETNRTCVFDEVDQGVSGFIAARVGEHLHKISDSSQTIVVSHLPQVVSKADHAIYVQKSLEMKGFSMSVSTLNKEELAEEVARLISGRHVTSDSLLQADQLMNERRKR